MSSVIIIYPLLLIGLKNKGKWILLNIFYNQIVSWCQLIYIILLYQHTLHRLCKGHYHNDHHLYILKLYFLFIVAAKTLIGAIINDRNTNKWSLGGSLTYTSIYIPIPIRWTCNTYTRITIFMFIRTVSMLNAFWNESLTSHTGSKQWKYQSLQISFQLNGKIK